MTIRIVEELSKEEKSNLFYVGMIMREDGWYDFFSDGNKNYTLIKSENQNWNFKNLWYNKIMLGYSIIYKPNKNES